MSEPTTPNDAVFEGWRMHERLAVGLAQDIVSGRLEPGSVFPTSNQLSEMHGVSRTVAREALQALAAGGLLRIAHGKRTVVNGTSDWRFLDLLVQRAMQNEELPEKLVRDLYQTRRCIETETARLCAQRGGRDTIEMLHALLGDMTALVPPGSEPTLAVYARNAALDRSLHGAISDGSGNVVLARIARDAHRGLYTSWHVSNLGAERLRLINEQHAEIVAAIEDRKPAAAADAMGRHIDWGVEDALSPRARSSHAE